jgi:hypothetical protein
MRLLIHLTDEKVQNSAAQPVVLCSRTNRYIKAMVKTIKKTLREFNHPVSVFHLPSALSESPVLLHGASRVQSKVFPHPSLTPPSREGDLKGCP